MHNVKDECMVNCPANNNQLDKQLKEWNLTRVSEQGGNQMGSQGKYARERQPLVLLVLLEEPFTLLTT